jgi:hypothetical protein
LEVTPVGNLLKNGSRFIHNTGTENTFVGISAGSLNLTGSANSSLGIFALENITSGGSNTSVGRSALTLTTTGNDNTAVGRSAGFRITTGSSNTFLGKDSGVDVSQLATANNSTAIGNGSFTDKSNQMVFGNASVSEILLSRNTSGIKVGVGTATPNLLGFGNEFTISGSSYTAQPEGFLNIQGVRTIDGNIGGVNFYNGASAIGAFNTRRSGANNSGRFVFETSNAGTLTEKMTILPNGNVGIGTASPDSRLFIDNLATFAGGTNFDRPHFTLKSGATGASGTTRLALIVGSGNQSYLESIRTADDDNSTSLAIRVRGLDGVAERMRITGAGNVGIGTTSPNNLLHISNSASFTRMMVENTNNAAGGAGVYLRTTNAGTMVSNATLRTTNDGVFSIFTGTTTEVERLTILASGNVGIGTASPAVALQISTLWGVSSDGITQWGVSRNQGVLTWDTNKVIIGGLLSNALELRSNNTARMFIDTTGNVGIGTTSPEDRLDIGSGYLRIKNTLGGTGTYGGIRAYNTLVGAPAAEITFIRDVAVDGNDGAILLRTTNAERMRITSTGNVGIGTTAPSTTSKLTIRDASIANIRTENTVGGFVEFGISANLDSIGFIKSNYYLNFITNNITRMYIDSTNGGVGIGTGQDTTSAQLQVKSGATNRIPLIVDTLASHADVLQSWRVNTSQLALITNGGRFGSVLGFGHTTFANSYVQTPTTGTIISRNVADTNPALIVNLENASATGNIQVWQKAGTAQSYIDNRGVYYNNETKLTLTEPTFTTVGGELVYDITEAQINANDVIELTKTASANSQNFVVNIPNNSKHVRIWIRIIPSTFTGVSALVNVFKLANELVKYFFNAPTVNSVSLNVSDISNYISEIVSNSERSFIYENTNGTQKSLSSIYHSEI